MYVHAHIQMCMCIFCAVEHMSFCYSVYYGRNVWKGWNGLDIYWYVCAHVKVISNVSCDLYLCLCHVLPPSVVYVGGEASGNAGKDRGTARVASPALAWSTAAASGGNTTADSDEM